MSSELDEPLLIQSARQGDLDAFNVLVDRYQGMLFRIALRILGDEDNAADATQMAWLSAFRNINAFRGDHLRPWLARVAINTCYDEFRRRHRRHEVPLLPINAEDDEIDTASWLADPESGVEEKVDAAEFEMMIHECLQSLTPVYRTMLVLVDIEGMSYEEAAIAARVPLGTVRSRLARARRALRQRLPITTDLWPARQRIQIPPTKHTGARYL